MDCINIAVPKGKMFEPSLNIFRAIGLENKELESDTRKLCIEDRKNKIKFYLLKPGDVTTFVEAGKCDIGFVGSDVIMEEQRKVEEVFDLGFGKCKMVLAGKGQNLDYSQNIKVATKYPRITKEFFKQKGVENVEIIKLNGSVEVGPISGLSDVIVDIVETGRTLEENSLEIIQQICGLSARLIRYINVSKEKESRLNVLIESIIQEVSGITKKEVI